MIDRIASPVPRIGVSVMAHPRRAVQADALAADLTDLPTRVVFDPDPSGPPSSVRVATLAWRPWCESATHHLVIQDDVRLHPHFTTQVRDAVRSQPTAALSLFSEWGSFTSHAVRVAAFAGLPWVRQPDTYLATVAMVLPVHHAHRFADALARSGADVPDDHAAFQYARDNNLRHYVSNPNLVEHDHLPSLVGNTGQGLRRATIFVPDWVAPSSWWRKKPYEDFTALPSVHWTSGTPSSYEARSDPQARWVIRGQRDHWGEAGGLMSSLVSDETATLIEGVEDVRLRSALLGAASILVDQVVLAARLAQPLDGFAVACATEAARTLAPGSLRGLATELNTSADSKRIRETFVRLASRVRASILALTDE